MTTTPDRLSHIRIVLVETSHPGNVGATARAMKTMGLGRLYLVNPRAFPHADADARATGARDVLAAACVCETLDEALAGTTLRMALSGRRRDLAPREADVREAAREAIGRSADGEVAVVFGSERVGLDIEAVSRCHLLVRIPANPDYSSLNLAAAVQVVSYELRMASLGEAAGKREDDGRAPEAAHEDLEGMIRHLEQTMLETGFIDPARPGRIVQRMRRLFARARPEPEEVAILRGFFRAASGQRNRLS